MGRFGSLFRKSDDKKSDQADDNPYAQQPSGDSYSPQAPSTASFQSNSAYNNYQYRQNQAGLPSGPRPGAYSGGLDRDSAPPPYNQSPSLNSPSDKKYSPSASPSGYANDRFGAQNGWGGNRYDNASASNQNNALPPQRPGGYGGLNEDSSPLFSGYNPQSSHNLAPSPAQYPGQNDQWGNVEEMTAEEREEQEVQMKKDEIVGTLRDTVSSTKRSRQMLEEATGRMVAMNEMLARDAAMLNRAEDRLDESHHQSKLASTHLDNLDAANTSIFNLTANSRGKIAERNARKHQATRDRELAAQELRREEQLANKEWEASAKPKPTILGTRGRVDNSKYVFDDRDGEQEQLNDEINDDIDALSQGVTNLNVMASAMGRELDRQLDQTGRMSGKADKSQDHLNKNRAHMARNYGTGRS